MKFRYDFFIDEHLNIVFATGTDEHGNKIDKKAQLEKKDTKEYCDEISCKSFSTLYESNIYFPLLRFVSNS